MRTYLAWMPASFPDFVAGVLVIAGIALMGCGIDGEVKSLTSIGAGWLFGSSWQKRERVGK